MSDETFVEQIARLELMAAGDAQWDLSDNDQAAIRALLEKYRANIPIAVAKPITEPQPSSLHCAICLAMGEKRFLCLTSMNWSTTYYY